MAFLEVQNKSGSFTVLRKEVSATRFRGRYSETQLELPTRGFGIRATVLFKL